VIFLDANVFLRLLGAPRTPIDAERGEFALAMFRAIRDGRIAATTSEVVLHEVCFVLTSTGNYGHPPTQVATDMMDLIQHDGFHFPAGEHAISLRALELWHERPQLGFADAVIAVRCERAGHDLATFDRHFDAIPTVARWQWDATLA